MTTSIFPEEGNWYKGNMHMHTTRSDGRVSPDVARQIYKDAGYDFIAITDHWKASVNIEAQDGFLELAGAEYDTGDMVTKPIHHIVGVGMTEPVDLALYHMHPVEDIIDKVRQAGGIAIYAHPAWSLMDPWDITKLKGIVAAEVWNSVSDTPSGNGRRADSSQYFDLWGTRGIYIPAMAADDSHQYRGEETVGFTMVKAAELTRQAILDAIVKGHFYASQGPRIISITRTDNRIHLCCSDAAEAYFVSNNIWSDQRVQDVRGGEAWYDFNSIDTYVRIELRDEEGRMAWSSPIRK
ncbi:PHP domain-containing protein [Butyrivibrio sp. MC2013]|uniref:PHP domain-containing protein n=1 Tax=Butyrivibrio sp. MC2013 TaxID=1280686 RepID=UPI000404487C|nr:CehA/McbA family metallohydrolase [Butyrivibrio sp. MC2013]